MNQEIRNVIESFRKRAISISPQRLGPDHYHIDIDYTWDIDNIHRAIIEIPYVFVKTSSWRPSKIEDLRVGLIRWRLKYINDEVFIPMGEFVIAMIISGFEIDFGPRWAYGQFCLMNATTIASLEHMVAS
jgi:hypothetical protein